jgi:ketosteroid isomerase-like protein
MSQENVETVKEFTKAFEAGDRNSWRDYFDSDVTWDTSESAMPLAGTYHGHRACRGVFVRSASRRSPARSHQKNAETRTVWGSNRGSKDLRAASARASVSIALPRLHGPHTAARDTAWAMSTENVEAVLRAYAAFSEGDLTSVLQHFDPEVVSYTAAPLDPAEYRGHEGFLEWCDNWLSAFDEFAMEVESHVDTGEAVVLRARQRATGATSGVPVERTFWFVHVFSGGRIARIGIHANEEQALEAVGLSE